jgi:hypothetical protein
MRICADGFSQILWEFCGPSDSWSGDSGSFKQPKLPLTTWIHLDRHMQCEGYFVPEKSRINQLSKRSPDITLPSGRHSTMRCR